ncbi:MAG: hypothetical protein KAU58_00690 [Candidatus Omnitrophica bacterium]|nr:hypothetical protein [Candidatus Omnitrophota bacterium]
MKQLTPLKAIRAKCLDCCGNHPSQVRKCDISDCPLFIYRLGHNPKRKGIGAGSMVFYEKSRVEWGKIVKKGQKKRRTTGQM